MKRLVQLAWDLVMHGAQGELGTGYEPSDGKGRFECLNCHFYRPKNSSCGQETMILLSQQPRTADGRIKVDPEGCCDLIDRIGEEDEGTEEEKE